MSEVDRLSNSGLYPMLPISDGQRGKNGDGKEPRDPRAPTLKSAGAKPADSNSPKPPKSLIDEYA